MWETPEPRSRLWIPDALALGTGPEVIVGWWLGRAAGAADVLGAPLAELPVARGTDLDLAVWRVTSDRLADVVRVCGIPTLLATPSSGWVLIAPPSSDDLFLYPERSASD